ncbi:TolC family protein [Taibaiella chishuiensis]|uniref:Outer membrane protein TolC n=1 Tax=Taibaiella chishuiensis TaxID=1434707 RepID=A0A2P8D8E3_9BACT|nr:TolC family protein [Taibaiella chishuiensis]PSK93469.1 outer membrane protein TolC [Taibaiella chishuiensis]
MVLKPVNSRPLMRHMAMLLLLLPYYRTGAQQLIPPQLKDPVQQAIRTDYGLMNQSLEAAKTQTMAEGVKAKLLPEVSAIGGYSYFYGNGTIDIPSVTLPITGIELFKGSRQFSTYGNIATVGLHATQVIFSGLQITNGEKALEQKAKAQQLMAEASAETVAKEVLSTFDQVMLLQEADKLIADSETRLEKEQLRVTDGIHNGLAIPYDRDKITLAMLELKAKKTEVAGNRKVLLQKLAQLTHMPVETLAAIRYPLERMQLAGDRKPDVEQRKELQALKLSGQAYDFLLRKEKGAALPQLFAFGSVSYFNLFRAGVTAKDVGILGDVHLKLNQMALMPNVLVGVGAKWNIYSGGHIRHKAQEVKYDIAINNNKIQDTREKLNLLLQKNTTDYETAGELIAVGSQQLKIAQNNMHMAGKQFEEGLIDVTERLEAENDLFKASLNYYMQVVQQRRTALEILHTSGTLLDEIRK